MRSIQRRPNPALPVGQINFDPTISPSNNSGAKNLYFFLTNLGTHRAISHQFQKITKNLLSPQQIALASFSALEEIRKNFHQTLSHDLKHCDVISQSNSKLTKQTTERAKQIENAAETLQTLFAHSKNSVCQKSLIAYRRLFSILSNS